MTEQNEDAKSDMISVQENLLDCWQEGEDLPSNVTVDSMHFSEDSLLITLDSHHHESYQKPKTVAQEPEQTEQPQHTTQGEKMGGLQYWPTEGNDVNYGCWKIHQIKEVSQENTSIQENEIKQTTQSQFTAKQIEFEVDKYPLGQFSQKLQQQRQITQEGQVQTEQTDKEKVEDLGSIGEQKINTLTEQSEKEHLGMMDKLQDQIVHKDLQETQIALPQIIQPLNELISIEQFNPQSQIENYPQHIEEQVVNEILEQPPAPQQENPKTDENKEEPMEIEFIGFRKITYQEECILTLDEDHKGGNTEQPMEIESQPVEVEEAKQCFFSSQNLKHISQQNPYNQINQKGPAHTLIQPILMPESEPPMNESMISSNLFTFGKEHPNQQKKEGPNILEELQETESVYLPDEIPKDQNQVLNNPEKQKKPEEIQNNIQSSNLALETQKLAFPQRNFLTTIYDFTLPETLSSVVPLPPSCPVIKKQYSMNQAETCDRNESCDRDLLSCKFDQTEIVQDLRYEKSNMQQKHDQPNQHSQRQVVSKIQAVLDSHEQITEQAQPSAPISPQNNSHYVLIEQNHLEQNHADGPCLQTQTSTKQIQARNRLIVSKVVEFLLPASTQNHTKLIQAELSISSNINNDENIQPLQKQENLKETEFKIESAANQYLINCHLTQQDHKKFEQILTPYVQLKFLIEPLNAIGSYLCQNGLILIAVTNLITRDSKTVWLVQYIYEYLSKAFNIEKYQQLFKREMEKANQIFIKSLDKMLIGSQVQQDSKQEPKEEPIKRRYQTTQYISINTNKTNHHQQTSNKKLVLNSNSMNINEKLGPYKETQTKLSQTNQKLIDVQVSPVDINKHEQKTVQVRRQPEQRQQQIEQKQVSPISKHKSSSMMSIGQKEGKADDILIKLSQKLLKEEEVKIQASKKRQSSINENDHKKDSKYIGPEANNAQSSKFNELYEKYKRIRQNRQSKSNEGNKIASPQIYKSDQKQGDSVEHVIKKVQFVQDLRDDESRDEEESHRKKKKQRKSKNKKDSSIEESDYEQCNQKDKLRRRAPAKK